MLRSSNAERGGAGVLAPPRRDDADRAPRRPRRDGGRHGGPPQGGDGDGGDDSGPRRDPPPDERPSGASELALALTLALIGTLFGVFLVVALLLRSRADAWPPAELRGAPSGLWASTALLALSSVAMALATRAQRALRRVALLRWIRAALAIGLAFVGAQAWVWRGSFASGLGWADAYGGAFYALTGLHAVHVLGGLGAIAWLARRLPAAAPTEGATRAVRRVALYWHFMGALWIALFVVLTLST